jgi:hypothetical protein
MRTFYFFLTFIILTMPFYCEANNQYLEEKTFFDNYYEYLGDSDDFSKGSEYRRYIKGIYRPGLLEKFLFARKRIKNVTSVSGSVNIESWRNQDTNKKTVDLLGEVAIENKEKRRNRWKYSFRAKTDLSSGGATFSLSRKLTDSLRFSVENEFMQDLGLSGSEYNSMVKLKGNFDFEEIFNWFKKK